LETIKLRKILIVALFGVALFVGSFAVSSKMNAFEAFCNPNSIWYDIFGNQQCGNSAAVGGEYWMASYYGYSHAGLPTASGEPFVPQNYTAAHKTLPMGTQLQVSYGSSSVTVTVNDRGPYIAGRDVDLSQGAAETIGLTGPGVAPVQVRVL
jgi:rare lipoprotein A (peptidoglycan hydrolase)